MFCICIDISRIYESKDIEEIFKLTSQINNRKLIIKDIFNEKFKDMLENPIFEKNCYSITAEGIYKNAHDTKKLIKWLAFYDRSYYENIN